MPHASIKDIARILNLSTSTVSRALRGSYDINADTQRRVLALAEQLNYRPSNQAIGLVKRKTLTLGIVVPAIDNEFFSNAIHGMEESAYKLGYHVIINQTHDLYEREVRIVDEMIKARVDGVIISLAHGTEDFGHLKRLQELQVPMVLFDRICDVIQAHKVINDNFQGAYKATSHLIARGYQRIAHLAGPESIKLAHERLNGYYAALRDAGRPVDKQYVIRTPFYREESRKAAHALLALPQPPDAIFGVSDNVAIGALLAARDLGLEVPRQLGLVGFSNLSVSSVLTPALSTVHQPAREMGLKAAELLIQTLEDPGLIEKPRIEIFPTTLIVRAST